MKYFLSFIILNFCGEHNVYNANNANNVNNVNNVIPNFRDFCVNFGSSFEYKCLLVCIGQQLCSLLRVESSLKSVQSIHQSLGNRCEHDLRELRCKLCPKCRSATITSKYAMTRTTLRWLTFAFTLVIRNLIDSM